MTAQEFNDKYKDYIEEGFCGLSFDIEPVTKFLDKLFQYLTRIPGFEYA